MSKKKKNKSGNNNMYKKIFLKINISQLCYYFNIISLNQNNNVQERNMEEKIHFYPSFLLIFFIIIFFFPSQWISSTIENYRAPTVECRDAQEFLRKIGRGPVPNYARERASETPSRRRQQFPSRG